MLAPKSSSLPVYRLNEKPPPRYSQNDVFNLMYDNPEGKKFSDIKGSNSDIATRVLYVYENHLRQHPNDLATWGRAYPEKYKGLMRARENNKKQKQKKVEEEAEVPSKKKAKVTPPPPPAPAPPPKEPPAPLRAQDVDSMIIAHLELAVAKMQSMYESLDRLNATTRDLHEKFLAAQ
jgi:hypothetical protein